MIEILSKFYVLSSKSLSGVAHSFTGTIAEAKKYLDLGFYLGFNGIITFTDQYDEMIKTVPLDRILLETDSPYLTPLSRRSSSEGGRTRNEPIFITSVVDKISVLKGVSLAQVREQTVNNTIKLFNLE
jgi:TatD DNase family protein